MGMFLSMSGVATDKSEYIEAGLRAYATRHDGHFFEVDDHPDSSEVLIMSTSAFHRTTIAYPSKFFDWDDASQFLSRYLHVPVFSFHIHEGDLWMYVLYEDGRETDCFNPVPDYWNKNLSDSEIQQWSGDAVTIAANWPDVTAESIGNYLVQWEFTVPHTAKAYSDDEFTFNECWQLLDFMKKLGLDYPFDDRGEPRGKTYRFEVWGHSDV